MLTRGNWTKMALACWEKAADGDVSAQTFMGIQQIYSLPCLDRAKKPEADRGLARRTRSRGLGSEWEMLEDQDFWVKRLHPDDAPKLFAKMAPLVEQGGGTIEYRFRHRDGHYVSIQDTFRVVRDDTGAASEIVGSWADITHRKQVERALGERMALMDDLQNLVAASPAVIYTTKASGDFACTFVSENLLSTMGYAPWEMRKSKVWSKRLHPEDAPRATRIWLP